LLRSVNYIVIESDLSLGYFQSLAHAD
jgi:hypothetical protein